MQRNNGETGAALNQPMIIGSAVCAVNTESCNTCSVEFSLSESEGIDYTYLSRAGLTAKQATQFFAKIQQGHGCWEWQGARLPKGYGLFNAGRWPNGKQDTRYAHRVIWELFQGRIPQGRVVRHKCDNPPCCNPSHLLIGTQGDNVGDAKRQGRYATAAQRRWLGRGTTHPAILEALNAPPGTLRRLCDERGLNYLSMKVALTRARKARQQSPRKVA